MKTLAFFMVAAAAALTLSSCGSCACNSYSQDALRDVPVNSYRSFE